MPLYGFIDVPELSVCKCGCTISTQLQRMAGSELRRGGLASILDWHANQIS